MTPHPLVTQLRFTRVEFLRCLDGVSDEDARHRRQPPLTPFAHQTPTGQDQLSLCGVRNATT